MYYGTKGNKNSPYMAEKETCQKWQNPKMPTKRLRISWKNVTKYLSKYFSEWQKCSQGKIKSKQICKIGLKLNN